MTIRNAAILPLLALGLALASCGEPEPEPQTPEEDARDIAMVEAAQDRHPPVRKLVPQPISFAEIEKMQISGAGCGFVPQGAQARDAVLVTTSETGLLKAGGQLVTLASDTGSAEFPYGTRKIYTAKAMWLELEKGGGEGEALGEEAVRWPGTLTVRDQWDRIIYQSAGSLDCGA